MGFWNKLWGRDYKWYAKKAQAALEQKDFGQAKQRLEKGMALVEEDSKEQEELLSLMESVREGAFEQAVERTRTYIRMGNLDSAHDNVELALRYAETEEDKEIIKALSDRIEQMDDLEEMEEDGAAHIRNPEDLGYEDKWQLMSTSLPFAKAAAFDKLGKPFKRAWIDLQEGKVDKAIEGFRAVEKESPEDIYLLVELGRALFTKGQTKEAEKLLMKADELGDNIGVKLLRAEILWSMNRFDQAEGILQEAHDLDPEDKSALAAIAHHGLLSGDYDSGIDAIEVLGDMIPGDYSVWKLAGRLYYEAGRYDEALDAFDTVNLIYWIKDPQTQKLTFDAYSANMAVNLYLQKGDFKNREVMRLLEALRENTTDIDHAAVCLQMAQVHDALDQESRKTAMLDEADRFLANSKDRSGALEALKDLAEKIRAGALSFSMETKSDETTAKDEKEEQQSVVASVDGPEISTASTKDALKAAEIMRLAEVANTKIGMDAPRTTTAKTTEKKPKVSRTKRTSTGTRNKSQRSGSKKRGKKR